MKLQYNQGGSTDTINLVDYPPSMHRLAIQKNGQTYYAKLGEANHPEATNIKVRRNNKTLSIIKNYDSRSFEEIGNVSTAVSDTVTVNSVKKEGFSRGIYIPDNAGYVKLLDLPLGERNFTLEQFMMIESIPALDTQIFGITQDGYKTGLAVGTYASAIYYTWVVYSSYISVAGSGKATTIPRNTWFHFEIDYVHYTGVHRFFVNGVQTASFTGKRDRTPVTFQIMGSGVHALECRVSDGIARHSSDFTPPTKPYEVDQYTVALLHF